MFKSITLTALTIALASACQSGSGLDTREVTIPAGPDAQQMGIAEYQVVVGEATLVHLIAADGADYGVLAQWNDEEVDYVRVSIAGASETLEVQTRLVEGTVANTFYVNDEERGQLVQSPEGEVQSDDLFLEDVIQHLDTMSAVRSDPNLKEVLGDPAEEFVLYGSCPRLSKRLLSCGVCSLQKTVCLLSPNRNQCLQQAEQGNDCQACLCR